MSVMSELRGRTNSEGARSESIDEIVAPHQLDAQNGIRQAIDANPFRENSTRAIGTLLNNLVSSVA